MVFCLMETRLYVLPVEQYNKNYYTIDIQPYTYSHLPIKIDKKLILYFFSLRFCDLDRNPTCLIFWRYMFLYWNFPGRKVHALPLNDQDYHSNQTVDK
jgi:hypothetical protein